MFLKIYSVWLGVFSISFIFLPAYLVAGWRKKGTSDGFSSVMFVVGIITQSFWLRHGWMTNNWTGISIHSAYIFAFCFYISAFAYYQSNRKPLFGQLIAAALFILLSFLYVDSYNEEKKADVMGSFAAGAQILGLGGRMYELKRAVSLGTTEYIPAVLQFAVASVMAQWLIFGFLTANKFIVIANAAGLSLSFVTVFLYFKYPPLTWTVPIFNIKPVEKVKNAE